jgi:hypothetical protein
VNRLYYGDNLDVRRNEIASVAEQSSLDCHVADGSSQ